MYLCEIHGVLSTLDADPCSWSHLRLFVFDFENICHFLDRDQGQFGRKDIVEAVQRLDVYFIGKEFTVVRMVESNNGVA